MKTENNKIVVTGMGVLSPLGVGIEPFWKGLIEGRCGVNKITQFPVEDDLYPCKIAGEVPELDTSSIVFNEDPILYGRYPKLALTALRMAIEDAGLIGQSDILKSADLYIGSAGETGDVIEALIASWVQEKNFILTSDAISQIDPHALTTAASKMYGLKRRAVNISSSCTSGMLALWTCVEYMQVGMSKVGLVVGADTISPLIFLGVGLTGELSTRNDDPEHASRPFDRDQDGYVLGEGAVALVVETEQHALSRGAHIYAKLGPFGVTTDATSFKYIDETGTQMARGMAMVLDKVPPEEIDYFNAHACAITALDRAESIALKKAFGKHADDVPVTSIKGSTANPSAAVGMLQVVSGILSIRDGIIPPTLNLENPLSGYDLNFVNTGPRYKEIGNVFISTHGGGGFNVSLTIHACTQ